MGHSAMLLCYSLNITQQTTLASLNVPDVG
jgi:hypothetical protein